MLQQEASRSEMQALLLLEAAEMLTATVAVKAHGAALGHAASAVSNFHCQLQKLQTAKLQTAKMHSCCNFKANKDTSGKAFGNHHSIHSICVFIYKDELNATQWFLVQCQNCSRTLDPYFFKTVK